jgi:hypothetical protein
LENLRWLSQCAPDGQSGAGRGSTAFYDQCRADAARAVEVITVAAKTAGIDTPQICWVLQGPDRSDKEVPRQLNAIYASLAAETPLISATIDAGHDVSMAAYPELQVEDARYTWTQYLPCSASETDTARFYLDGQLDVYRGQNTDDADCWHCNTASPGLRIAAEVARVLGI